MTTSYLEDVTLNLERAKNRLATASRDLANFRRAKFKPRPDGNGFEPALGEGRRAVARELAELEFEHGEAQQEFQAALKIWSAAKGPCGSTPPDTPNFKMNSFGRMESEP